MCVPGEQNRRSMMEDGLSIVGNVPNKYAED